MNSKFSLPVSYSAVKRNYCIHFPLPNKLILRTACCLTYIRHKGELYIYRLPTDSSLHLFCKFLLGKFLMYSISLFLIVLKNVIFCYFYI